MLVLELMLPAAVSFLTTLLVTPRVIRYCLSIGLVGRDVHKKDKAEVAESGGIAVLVGFLTGAFAFVSILVFRGVEKASVVDFLAATIAILLSFVIGFIDDVSSISGRKFGLKQWEKPVLTFFSAFPLVAVKSGVSKLCLPVVGAVDIGLLYPLLVVPVAIMGASNATNMLAGLNGLEAGLGAITLIAIALYSLLNGKLFSASLALIFAFSLIAFLKYNFYPARIFPGDSLTYMIGCCIACCAIIGNIEKFCVVCFLPWFIELVLKARGRFKKQSFGRLMSDNTLKPMYDKCYSLTHVIMRLGRFTEKQVVLILYLLQILLVSSALFYFSLCYAANK